MARSRKGGVLIPTAQNVVAVPAVAYDLANMDDRKYRGYVLYQKILEGGKFANVRREVKDTSGEDWAAYSLTNENGKAYIVKRSTNNQRGTMTTTYDCGCDDYKKNMRSGCKHTFCEQLYRKEATTYGEPPAREPRRSAQRREPRNRRGANGKSVRTNQRLARIDMPSRVPQMIDEMRRAEDRRRRQALNSRNVVDFRARGGQMTTDSTRAAALILKVSNGVSSDAMQERYQTYIDRGVLALQYPPHANTISLWMNDKTLEPLLMALFYESTKVFRAQETVGIVDSTKLSNAQTASYRGLQYRGDDRPDARWLKCHVISGLESNAVLAFEFSDQGSHDSRYYEKLVTTAMKTFALEYVLADRAYLSARILGWSMETYGIKAVIPIKKKWEGGSDSEYHEVCAEAIDWYDNRRKSFDEMYRFRAKIEAVFSVIKRMFHGYVWSKGRKNEGADDGLCQAWRNETICKLIAYNLRCAVLLERPTGVKVDFLRHDRFFPEIPVELRAMQVAA